MKHAISRDKKHSFDLGSKVSEHRATDCPPRPLQPATAALNNSTQQQWHQWHRSTCSVSVDPKAQLTTRHGERDILYITPQQGCYSWSWARRFGPQKQRVCMLIATRGSGRDWRRTLTQPFAALNVLGYITTNSHTILRLRVTNTMHYTQNAPYTTNKHTMRITHATHPIDIHVKPHHCDIQPPQRVCQQAQHHRQHSNTTAV